MLTVDEIEKMIQSPSSQPEWFQDAVRDATEFAAPAGISIAEYIEETQENYDCE